MTKQQIDDIRNKIPPIHETLRRITKEDAKRLKIGDLVDHRDHVGRFLTCSILNVDPKHHTWKLHYEGWSSKFDVDIHYLKELKNLATAYSISQLGSNRLSILRKNDIVLVKAPQVRGEPGIGWIQGEVRKFHVSKKTDLPVSGQVQIAYRHPAYHNRRLYWFHIDNTEEFHWIDEFGTNEAKI